jgi:hypothetical protein
MTRRHYAIMALLPGPDRYREQAGIPVWARHTRRRDAVRIARAYRGQVYAISYGSRDSWDAPTFRACGDLIADFGTVAR